MKRILFIFLFIGSIANAQWIKDLSYIPSFQLNNIYVNTTDTVQNYSASFDVNNYLVINDQPSLTFADKTTRQDKSFYVSFFAKANLNNTGFFTKPNEYQLRALTNGVILCDLFDSLATTSIGRQSGTTAMNGKWNTWAHYVLTYDGSETQSGIDIYIDGSIVDVSNRGTGSYNSMYPKNSDLQIGRVDATYKLQGQMIDFRIGERFLSSSAVDSLGFHQILGDELVIIPLTGGTGNYATNVTFDNLQYAAKNTNDINKVLWDTAQTVYNYNNSYGYRRLVTSVDTLVFPNLIDSTPSFTPLLGDILWGQSNAGGLAVSDSLIGTVYEPALDWLPNYHYHNYVKGRMEPLRNGLNSVGSAANLGLDPLLGLKYNNDDKQSFVLKYSVGSTALDSIGVSVDWNPKSQEIYKTAKDTAILGLNDVLQRGRNPFINSLIWIQGERDAELVASAPKYAQNLNILYDSVSDVFQEDINMQLVLLGQFTGTYTDTVKKYQRQFANSKANVDTINTDNATYTSCCTHYDDSTFIWMADTIYDRRNDIFLPESKSYLLKKYGIYTIYNYLP